jgi:hypothetical protein
MPLFWGPCSSKNSRLRGPSVAPRNRTRAGLPSDRAVLQSLTLPEVGSALVPPRPWDFGSGPGRSSS